MNRPPVDPLSEQLAEERLADLDRRRAVQRRRFYTRRPKRIGNIVAQLVQRKGYAQIRAAGEREEAWRTALGEQGDECGNYPGVATCGDGLGCFSVDGYPTVCSPYCSNTDPEYACPDDALCLPFQSGAASQCEPEMADGDSTGGESSTT